MIPYEWKRRLHEQFVRSRISHVSGAKYIELADNEAAVTCVVRDGEYYIDSFIQHYSKLGFRHIFILDNGSDDQTIAIAQKYANVTVYRCALPVGKYQELFKKCFAELTVRSGWCFDADIDEFFDYPYSRAVSLEKLLEYLNSRSFTCVLVQMLDMFSDKPISSLASDIAGENLREVYRFYDLSNTREVEYRQFDLTRKYARDNRLGNRDTTLFLGGIRKTLQGIDCLLSKHSLFRTDRGVELFPHVHFVNQSHIADISGAILHYKFVSNTLQAAVRNRKAFPTNSAGYEDLIRLIESRPDHKIKEATAMEYGSAEDLVEDDFLFVSTAYKGYCGV